jgi:predicted phage terminase large subunit-like protein
MEGQMTILTPAEYRSFLRRDLVTFTQRCFHELYPQTKFLMNWHIELMLAKLEACRLGKINRLIIVVPPRHLKSLCASVALPAFWLGHNPAAQIICVSYGQELSDKLARDCRAIMNTSWYQSIFPARLSTDKQSVQEFTTTAKGFRLATSVGGVLTGRGGDVIIIDDPLKPDEAFSESQRRNCNQWHDHTLRSRLNDKQKGCIILIMQRLHEDDLVGHVLSQEDWEVVRLPAIAEEDEKQVIETVLGRLEFIRRAGEVLHSERESKDTLDGILRTIGSYNFAGQYQQTPAPFGGGLIKEAWLNRYGPAELPTSFDQILQSWDTANKAAELNDYSACTTWGIKDKRFYLLHVLRKRMEFPALKRAVREQSEAFNPDVILIEDKASGTQLIQELLEESLSAVTRYKSEGDKVMRLVAHSATFENGFVHLPREAHWLQDYIHELTTFPASKYDDQVDSTSQALAWIKQRVPGWGILEFYRRSVEEARCGPSSNVVRLKAPPGISHVYTITGRQVMVSSDGTVELSEKEATPLLGAGFQRIEPPG